MRRVSGHLALIGYLVLALGIAAAFVVDERRDQAARRHICESVEQLRTNIRDALLKDFDVDPAIAERRFSRVECR